MPPPVKMVPAATFTPGTSRTFLRIPAGKLMEVLVCWVTGCLLVITTEVPFSESLKIWSKALLMVSVITYVPAIRETPTSTATVVPSARSLRAQRLLIATLAKLLHQLDHVVGRAGGGVGDERASAEREQAIREGRGLRRVGDHHHRLIELVDRLPEEAQDILGGL